MLAGLWENSWVGRRESEDTRSGAVNTVDAGGPFGSGALTYFHTQRDGTFSSDWAEPVCTYCRQTAVSGASVHAIE